MDTRTVQVYLEDGRIFEYDVNGDSPETVAAKAREHCHEIVRKGYRHNDGTVFEYYPPHKIAKVKTHDIPTKYPDRVAGT